MKTSDMLLIGLAGFVAYEFLLKPKSPQMVYPINHGALPHYGGNSTASMIPVAAGTLLTALGKFLGNGSVPAVTDYSAGYNYNNYGVPDSAFTDIPGQQAYVDTSVNPDTSVVAWDGTAQDWSGD